MCYQVYLGLFTGISAFLENDRKQNPTVDLFLLDYHYFFFSDGFYITISILTIVALLSFKLYRFYFYRLFAIVTWIFIIGSLSQYFDSAFNGFSFPERRWVYILALSSSALCGLFIQHLSTLKCQILFNQNNTRMHHRITLCITITDTPTCTYSRYYPANGACRYFKI